MSSPFDNELHELRLGNSFDQRPKVGFHTIRYDFQPASVDASKEACVEVGEGNQVTVTVPHVQSSGIPHTVFKGNKQNLLKECVLIIDHDKGTYTLEKLASKVTLKKTRLEGSSKAMQYMNAGRITPVDTKKSTASSKVKAPRNKVSPEKEKIEKEKEKPDTSGFCLDEAMKGDHKKGVAEMSDSLSSSDDDDDMEDVKPISFPQPAPPPPPPPHPHKAPPKFQQPTSSSSSSNVRNYGVLDNDLALSESSSDDDSD